MGYTKIPETFLSEDIIYHYCHINTAVEYILHEKKLRLSPRRHTNDPLETLKPFFTNSGMYVPDDTVEKEDERRKLNEIIRCRAIDKIGNAKQVSFCMNDVSNRIHDGTKNQNAEYFGFSKPRMWDQYADNYRGVCLAFSLDKLIQNAPKCEHGAVKYYNYSILNQLNLSIDELKINMNGIEDYWNDFSKRISNQMFWKHSDYKGENEYRFISFNPSDFDYINISDSLLGIILSNNFTSDFMKQAIENFAEENRIELLYLSWEQRGFSIQTRESKNKILRAIEETRQHLNK
jgi:hypothetical protein